MKKARAIMLTAESDALRERDSMPEIYRQYLKLDTIDRAKVEAYITGLLSADKYQSPPPVQKCLIRRSGKVLYVDFRRAKK